MGRPEVDETKLSSGPVRSALQLLLQGKDRAAAAVLVMAKAHATLLHWCGGRRVIARGPAKIKGRPARTTKGKTPCPLGQIEQCGHCGDRQGARKGKMGKPVRKTL